MVSLKEDRFLQFTMSSGNMFQSLMVAGKRVFESVCSINGQFELLIHVFLVIKCRCESAGIATRPFVI